jgi:hypothetical protein
LGSWIALGRDFAPKLPPTKVFEDNIDEFITKAVSEPIYGLFDTFFAWRGVSTSKFLQLPIVGIVSRLSRGLLEKITRRKDCLSVWKAKRER